MRGLAVAAVLVGCAHSAPRLDPRCVGATTAIAIREPGSVGVLRKRTVANVTVTGTDPDLARTLERVLATRAGDSLDHARVAEDIRRLWALGVVSDVQVDVASSSRGDAVSFEVKPQPLIDHVYVSGSGAGALELRRLRWLAGTPFEPVRVARIAGTTQASLVYDGYLDAKIAVSRATEPGVGVCVRADLGPRVLIGKLAFPGHAAISEGELAAKLRGTKGGINHVGGIYDAGLLAEDLPVLLDLYYERGRIDTHVDEPRTRREGDHLVVEIPIRESPAYRLDRIVVAAAGGEAVELGLAPGDIFVRSKIVAAIQRLQKLAGADAVISPLTRVDSVQHTVDVTFQIDWRWPWHALRLLRSR